MTILGRTSRTIPLGIKLDECAACQAIGPHAIARRIRWLEVLSLPLVRLKTDHVLVCGNCGDQAAVSGDVVKEGFKTGTMEIDRQRPLVAADMARRSNQHGGATSPSWSILEADPSTVRAAYDRRLREVLRIPGPNRLAIYARVWPALALIVAGAVLVPSGSAAMQAAGVGLLASSPSAGLASAPATPAPSPTFRPTPKPTDRPYAGGFAYWLNAYRTSILPCYSGRGSCDLDATIEYDDGSSAQLAAEAARLAGLYRDNDSVQMGTTPSCRQEHGSMFALYASIAAEASVIKALKSGEVMPDSWRPTLGVVFEACTATRPNAQEGVVALGSLLTEARAQLASVKNDIRAKDWSEARSASGPMTELALQIVRASARDFPAGDGATWAPIRTLGWDMLRVSGLLEIKRLAAAKSTAELIDASISAIDQVSLGGS